MSTFKDLLKRQTADMQNILGGAYGAPVQDLAALSAVQKDDRADKQARFVEDELTEYYYDHEATSGDVQPDDAPATGYWVKAAAPAPAAHAANHKGDGSDPVANATGSVAGLMSAADKTSFDANLPTADEKAGLLTSAESTDLTDGGDSAAHWHSSDRDRANHTGTQAIATLSDFPAFGTGAGEICEGDDSRLSDARAPTAHASDHTDGTDDVQDATTGQKGLMTAAFATQLTNMVVPSGVTGSRPGSPATGWLFFDTTLGLLITFDGANWVDGAGTTV